MKTRGYVAAAVHVIGFAVALTLLWQAVRFCKGKVGAPLVDGRSLLRTCSFLSVERGSVASRTRTRLAWPSLLLSLRRCGVGHDCLLSVALLVCDRTRYSGRTSAVLRGSCRCMGGRCTEGESHIGPQPPARAA